MNAADRTWNEFNADFTFPPSDDAARIASEVKASIDTWVRNSLLELQEQTKRRTDVLRDRLDLDIGEASKVLRSVDARIADLQLMINQIPNTDSIQAAREKLETAAQNARKAVQDAVNEWEEKGKKVGATVGEIAQTFAKAAI